MTQTVLVAGATGRLGSRIAHHLLDRPEVEVRLLVRSITPSDEHKARVLADLTGRGAVAVWGDVSDASSLATPTAGVDVVVSAVQGGRAVIVDGQVALARAARDAGARRFIPSDFALDLWQAPPGAPMFALRREADEAVDALGLEVLHVLNGAFMDMMLDPRTAGVVDIEAGVGNYFGDGDDGFDVTLVGDIAEFTARLAVDRDAPAGTYRISGSRTSYAGIIAEVEQLTGRTFERRQRGTVADLRATIDEADNPWAVMGAWYNLAMIETPPFADTDNDRYPDAPVTSLHDYLRGVLTAGRPD